RPKILLSNNSSTSNQRAPFPPPPPLQQQQQQQQGQGQGKSPQIITSPIIRFPSSSLQRPPPPSSSSSSGNIPVAPPYEALANFSSSRSTTNKDRNLSYGNRQKQSNIYDTLLPGHYLRLYTNKYN
ncbi:unnamed protein product, partial [Rotaria sp. Silwood2]